MILESIPERVVVRRIVSVVKILVADGNVIFRLDDGNTQTVSVHSLLHRSIVANCVGDYVMWDAQNRVRVISEREMYKKYRPIGTVENIFFRILKKLKLL